MSVIPESWLIRQTTLEQEYAKIDQMDFLSVEHRAEDKETVREIFDQFACQMEAGDGIWWYSSDGSQSPVAGFALVRDGIAIAHKLLIVS